MSLVNFAGVAMGTVEGIVMKLEKDVLESCVFVQMCSSGVSPKLNKTTKDIYFSYIDLMSRLILEESKRRRRGESHS